MYETILSRQVIKDLAELKRTGAAYAKKAKSYVYIVTIDPFQNPPPYKKLRGNLDGCYSRKINDQHKFIYEVLLNIDNIKDENGVPYKGIVHVLRMWTHYE